MILLLAASCSAVDEGEPRLTTQPVTYGTDDRTELFESNAPALAERARQAVVALIPRATPDAGGDTPDPNAVWAAPTLSERRGLCPSEAFAAQPSIAECTGFLAADDLVLTAGHCARNLDCDALDLVFGYYYERAGAPHSLSTDDWYRCQEVLTYEVPTLFDSVDFGWIRLDRKVRGRGPLVVQGEASPVALAQPLHLFDFGAGLPMKTHRAFVTDPGAETVDQFFTNFDAFGGSSGAPVLDEAGVVVGILNSGEEDYELSADGCLTTARLSDQEGDERVTYAFQALAALGDPSEGLSTPPPESSSAGDMGGGCALRGPRPATRLGGWAFLLSALILLRARQRARSQVVV
jgi:hypothetical protein